MRGVSARGHDDCSVGDTLRCRRTARDEAARRSPASARGALQVVQCVCRLRVVNAGPRYRRSCVCGRCEDFTAGGGKSHGWPAARREEREADSVRVQIYANPTVNGSRAAAPGGKHVYSHMPSGNRPTCESCPKRGAAPATSRCAVEGRGRAVGSHIVAWAPSRTHHAVVAYDPPRWAADRRNACRRDAVSQPAACCVYSSHGCCTPQASAAMGRKAWAHRRVAPAAGAAATPRGQGEWPPQDRRSQKRGAARPVASGPCANGVGPKPAGVLIQRRA